MLDVSLDKVSIRNVRCKFGQCFNRFKCQTYRLDTIINHGSLCDKNKFSSKAINWHTVKQSDYIRVFRPANAILNSDNLLISNLFYPGKSLNIERLASEANTWYNDSSMSSVIESSNIAI